MKPGIVLTIAGLTAAVVVGFAFSEKNGAGDKVKTEYVRIAEHRVSAASIREQVANITASNQVIGKAIENAEVQRGKIQAGYDDGIRTAAKLMVERGKVEQSMAGLSPVEADPIKPVLGEFDKTYESLHEKLIKLKGQIVELDEKISEGKSTMEHQNLQLEGLRLKADRMDAEANMWEAKAKP